MPRVLNMHTATPEELEGAVYVGRGSKWGNRHKIGPWMSRRECIAAYTADLQDALINRELLSALHELRGKDLACWCAPAECHADVLLKLANADTLQR